MYFLAGFSVTRLEKIHVCQKCFGCYAVDKEEEEKETAMALANSRASGIYARFDEANINYNKVFYK